ncbi:hypothetical protein [Bacillus xiapuensis]|uniref:Uncharacterized protein n=1 Tax=Bacillus xiapuensis TaxID=2014075 RepID=A0ABU6NAY9_9BACI|nr:hypothetical protein [Bacillus xiapuensis]
MKSKNDIIGWTKALVGADQGASAIHVENGRAFIMCPFLIIITAFVKVDIENIITGGSYI